MKSLQILSVKEASSLRPNSGHVYNSNRQPKNKQLSSSKVNMLYSTN